MFKVRIEENRYRAKRQFGEWVACIFKENICRKVFKESFKTRAGAEHFASLLAKSGIGQHPKAMPGTVKYVTFDERGNE